MSEFDRIWNQPAAPIADPADEVALIKQAAEGSEPAVLRLLAAYVPALCAAIGRYQGRLDLDDARQVALCGFMEACRRFDPAQSDRLASVVRVWVDRELSATSWDSSSHYGIPTRTLQRYYGIIRAADGDPTRAATLAPEYHMDRATFLAVHHIITATTGAPVQESAVSASASRELEDVTDRVMVRHALGAVSDLERDVCRMAYGFSDYDPLPDAEIGHRLGMGRVRVLRTRSRALTTMRAALGVAVGVDS